MPVIDFENNLLTDYQWIRAIQLFPNDLNLRNQYFTMLMMDYKSTESKDSDTFEIDAKSLKLIINAPSLSEFKIRTVQAIKEAIVVGDVLATIYVMVKFNLPEPSLNKAYFVSQQFAKENKYGDGTSMAVSERYIKERWVKYKSVAHLWAAQRLLLKTSIAKDIDRACVDFKTFLGVAKELQTFGLNYIPLRAKPKKSLLDHETMWLLSESIEPKTLVSDIQPNNIIKTLKKYIAPQS